MNELQLPANLLQAIAEPAGGRVAIVVGAGCSHEAPTGLPLADDLSAECFRKLTADGLLAEGDVENPEDLSEVAEAVFRADGSQRELVDRFRPDDFRQAPPNDGYLIMAALMQEGAITTAMTLNFDLAATTALATLRSSVSISTIRGPEDHHRISARNLIYLHRDINADPNDLILRQESLESAWRDRWEQIVTQRVVAGSVTVFAGLGSPASVLIETTKRILQGLGSGASVYVVDPAERENSAFFAALELDPESYIQLGWGDLMLRLASRLVEEQRAELEHKGQALIHDLDLYEEDVTGVCQRLAALGLVNLGVLRAAWLLRDHPYEHHQPAHLPLIADLIVAIAMIERLTASTAAFRSEGIVEFPSANGPVRVIVCSGGGWMTRAVVESRLRFRRGKAAPGEHGELLAVAGGLSGPGGPPVAPSSIAGDYEDADITAGEDQFKLLTVTELRNGPEVITEIFS